MKRTLLLGLILLATAAGCSSKDDKPVIPKTIKQPPGPDAEQGPRGGTSRRAKVPDAATQSATER
jgi:hypothetical protein